MDQSEDDALRNLVRKALAGIVPPNARFPLSGKPVEVTIDRIDAARGEVKLNIGACRFVEGSQFAPVLEKELKARIPQLKSVIVGMFEI